MECDKGHPADIGTLSFPQNKMIPPHTDIAMVYNESSDADQELVLNLALFLTSFLSGKPLKGVTCRSQL